VSSSTKRQPRRLFRSRRQPAPEIIVVEIGVGPGKPLEAVRAFVEQHRHTFQPGIHEITIEHESDCRYPKGGACTCIAGPECRIVGLDPEKN
jgi:hypothetical protein